MPRYNLATKQGIVNCKKNVDYHTEKGHIIEQKYIRKTRTNLENRALHLYYKHGADALLEVGFNFTYINQMTGEFIEIPFTGELFKDHIWRPLQIAMFKIESTTKLTNQMINDILTALSPWLTEKNKYVKFPNKIDLLIKQMNESNN